MHIFKIKHGFVIINVIYKYIEIIKRPFFKIYTKIFFISNRIIGRIKFNFNTINYLSFEYNKNKIMNQVIVCNDHCRL